jgi:hypothetical protein
MSYSLSEYLSYLGKIHNIHLNENWGFYVDIERSKLLSIKKTEPILIPSSIKNHINKLSRIFSSDFDSNRNLKSIRSLKSVTNLNESTDSLIFKMDDIESPKKNKNKQKNLTFIGNLCVVSGIIVFLLLI